MATRRLQRRLQRRLIAPRLSSFGDNTIYPEDIFATEEESS